MSYSESKVGIAFTGRRPFIYSEMCTGDSSDTGDGVDAITVTVGGSGCPVDTA